MQQQINFDNYTDLLLLLILWTKENCTDS